MLVFLVKAGKETHWYDTILAYPAGMLYSLYKNRIEVLTRGWRWMLCALVTALVFAGFKYGFVNHFLSFSPQGPPATKKTPVSSSWLPLL